MYVDLAIARFVHVAAVVLWIGGVAMITTIVVPQGLAAFERVERAFAPQARVFTLLAGASGLYLAWRLDLWGRFAAASFWWMHAMVALWLVFSLVLFVLEPRLLRRWFELRVARDPDGALKLVAVSHWFLLAVSIVAIAGAAAGSHGLI